MKWNIVSDPDEKQWDTFIDSAPTGSFLQMTSWADLQEQLGVKYWQLQAHNTQGQCLLIKREVSFGMSWLYAPWGPVITNDSLWPSWHEAVVKIAEEENAMLVRADAPLQQTSWPLKNWKSSTQQIQPQHTWLLDLSLSEKDLLANMKSKTRYNIRLAEKKGVEVTFSSQVKDVKYFWNLAEKIQQKGNFHYHPKQYYEKIMNVLGYSGQAELAIAWYNNKPIATHVMIYTPTTATYVHGASDWEYRKVMAPTLLYWETIKRAKSRMKKQFDFFGIAPEDANDNHPWAGITRIKKGFGGYPVAYVGAYNYIVKPAQYELFKSVKKVRNIFR